MNQPNVDPWDSAENPQTTFASDYWGQCAVDTFYCVLEKGVGRVPFDPQTHTPDKRRTSIDVAVIPLPEMNLTRDVLRNMIAESKEWAGIVLPSIRNLGITLRELNGKFVKIHLKPTGQTYVNNQGGTKEKTTIEFDAVFPDEATCRADYLSNSVASNTEPAAVPVDDPGKTKALPFLKVVVQNAARGQTDLDVIKRTIAANISAMPMIGKFFTADSPETLDLIMKEMGK